MAVRKDAILSRPRETYSALLQMVRYSKDVKPRKKQQQENMKKNITAPFHNPSYDKWMDSRQICCAIERTWHMLFGLPPKLPKYAMVYDLLKEKENEKLNK